MAKATNPNVPGVSGLLSLIREAQRAEPAVRYALGVVGIAAAAGIISIVLGQSRSAIFLIGLVFVGMILLFVFSRALKVSDSFIRPAAIVLIWIVVAVFVGSLSFVFTAIAFKWPPGMVDFLFPNALQTRAALIEKVLNRTDIEAAADAIRQLSDYADRNPQDRPTITAAIKRVLDGTDGDERSLRALALSTLMHLTNNKLSSIFTTELENSDVVSANLTGADLSGASLKDAFVILTSFQNANLSNANMAGADLRGANFSGANFENTNLGDADWFNAFGITPHQIDSVLKFHLLPCPSSLSDNFESFTDRVNKIYVIQYENYS